MEPEVFARSRYEAELETSIATVHLARFKSDRPTDRVFRPRGHYWLDLSLTPRPENIRGCYRAHWGPHRYERLGEIILVPPGEALHIRSDGGTDQVSIVCEIAAEAIDRWMADGVDWTGRRLAAVLDIVHPHLRSCLYRLAQEARSPGAGSGQIAEMIVGQLAIELARYCAAVAEAPEMGGLASWRLRLIDERLAAKGAMPSLGDLARLCNMSVRQLTRAFRASRGSSVGDYIVQSRVDLAKRMLAGSGSIKAIAFDLGFGSPSGFSQVFRRATGSTPRQFRQRQLRGLGPG